MSPVISLKNVSKRFKQTLALDDVSLEVPRGVVFALLGENGAGKSTLIRILTGFAAPDTGRAEVLGHDCSSDSIDIFRSVGYVSDAPALYDWMKPPEIGWFTAAFYPEGFLKRYHQQIEAFAVPLHTRIKDLSKGQRAKVALALAIAHDPELLILDEPTSGLDAMVRRQFLKSMVDRAALGKTVFLSSHQIAEVERVADWVAILHQGKLKIVQPLEELKSNVKIVTATLDSSDGMVALPRGTVLSETRTGRQVRWIVKGLPDDWQRDYPSGSGVLRAEAASATLEEIFVATCELGASRPAEQTVDLDAPEPSEVA